MAASMGSNPDPLAESGVTEEARTQAAPSRFRRRDEDSHMSRGARPVAATLLFVASLGPRF